MARTDLPPRAHHVILTGPARLPKPPVLSLVLLFAGGFALGFFFCFFFYV